MLNNVFVIFFRSIFFLFVVVCRGGYQRCVYVLFFFLCLFFILRSSEYRPKWMLQWQQNKCKCFWMGFRIHRIFSTQRIGEIVKKKKEKLSNLKRNWNGHFLFNKKKKKEKSKTPFTQYSITNYRKWKWFAYRTTDECTERIESKKKPFFLEFLCTHLYFYSTISRLLLSILTIPLFFSFQGDRLILRFTATKTKTKNSERAIEHNL